MTLLLGTGCANTVLTHVDLEGSASATVQGVPGGSPTLSGVWSAALAGSEALAEEGVEEGDIRDAHVVTFELEAAEPAGADLSFLDEVVIGVEAPGREPVVVATGTDFPVGASTVALELEDTDLTDLVLTGEAMLTAELVGQLPEETTEVSAHYVVEVGVTLQGARNHQ